MRGFCKCDLCGTIYHEDENKIYDGITVWWKGKSDSMCSRDDKKLHTPDGKYITDIPEMMDVCPNCFELFYSWIGIQRRGIEKPCK